MVEVRLHISPTMVASALTLRLRISLMWVVALLTRLVLLVCSIVMSTVARLAVARRMVPAFHIAEGGRKDDLRNFNARFIKVIQ